MTNVKISYERKIGNKTEMDWFGWDDNSREPERELRIPTMDLVISYLQNFIPSATLNNIEIKIS